MSNVYNHRAMVPNAAPQNRIPDLLDALKTEFDNLTQEASANKTQRDDPDGKSYQAELNHIQQVLGELQTSHLQIKQKYEEEITRLQKELEMRGGPPAPGAISASHPPTAPPTIGHGQSNILGNMMPSSGNAQPPTANAGPMGELPPGGGPPSHSAGGFPGGAAYTNGGTTPQQPQKRLRSDTGESMHPMPVSQPSGYPHTPHDKNGKPMKPLTPTNPNAQSPLTPSAPKDAQMAVVGTKRKTSASSTTGPPARPPLSGKPGGAPGIGELDPSTVPNDMKLEGPDWFAVFNPKLPRSLTMDMVHSLEHSSVVCCVRFSNDGKFLATGCNRTAQIFDASTGDLIITLNDDNAAKEGDLYIRSVCFSPDGKYLATGAEDKIIRIWDLSSERICHTLRGHEQDIYSLDYSRDGRIIVSGSGDRSARLWDASTGKGLFNLAIDDVGPKDAGVTSVAISPDGRFVAAGSLDRMVRVWDAQSGYMLERLEGHKDSVYSVAFTPDGSSLISGSLDKTIKIWDLTNLQRTGGGNNPTPSAQSGGKSTMANPSDPSNLSNPTTPKTSTCRATLASHKDFVLSVACSPCGRWIVSGSKDRSVQFWDAHTTNTQFMLQGHKNSVISVAVSPAGGLFATGSGDCRARIWRYETL